ncbi:MAG: RecQ family ATP-dependent DNA helicase [Bacteroidales bacterium]|nr:RecQ family ATP-dependent DNA helicase [Bacteroidales bacterium]
MNQITFVDTEIDPTNNRILDIGAIKDTGAEFHSASVSDFIKFIKGTKYLCGHNIFNHDKKYIQNSITAVGIYDKYIVDTLFLSPLLFPGKPYHSLIKDDKLRTDDINNPLNDSIKSRDLFFDEVAAFHQLDEELKQIYFSLLHNIREFRAFFSFVGFDVFSIDLENTIRTRFHGLICENASIDILIKDRQIEFCYCLALINARSRYSIMPPWVVRNYAEVERIMRILRNKPCIAGCEYCNEALDVHKGLKFFFGFDSFRTYAGEPLQERAAQAAIDNKSLLAIFPTGGGKSVTFQLPALMSGKNSKGLTVIISPLQSLMKDQVDNLEKISITDAVTINGLLDPIERAKSFERVEDGSASILYISPESLRSRTIEKLLLGRNIVRFVIDEAHCFSAWGQDFRVDYLYIGDFIKSLQEKKNLVESIPVSCFTATAKPNVIEDIKAYFNEKLSIELEMYKTNASRSNLNYKVLEKENNKDKYYAVRNLVDEKNCPTIVYVSRTKRAEELALRLCEDGYEARVYHGQLDKQIKTENQDAFIKGNVQIMVATSAFGMGVDKKDVGMVIHYDISDSLENYVQEAGRAGRDENILADCYVLFSEEDLNKHFILLNQTKLSIHEIQQIWRSIKDVTRMRSRVSKSALEIARNAGWDDSIYDLETKVKTAINALEEAGYIKRGQNTPRIYADSIKVSNVMEAIDKIYAFGNFTEDEALQARRIITMLIGARRRSYVGDEDAETRVDYIADRLAMDKRTVIHIVNLLREADVLADAKDLSGYIKKERNVNQSLNVLSSFRKLEGFLLTVFDEGVKTFHIKELNEQAEEFGCKGVTPNKLKTITNLWTIDKWIKRKRTSPNHIAVMCLNRKEILQQKLEKRYDLAKFILEYLYNDINTVLEDDSKTGVVRVDFSILELKTAFNNRITMSKTTATTDEIEKALFYLTKIDAIYLEGGFLVVYNTISIERIEKDNRKRYKVEDYQKLKEYYDSKVQQIHIVGEYAQKMIDSYKDALQFVDDYFQLNYNSFLNKYFKGGRQNQIKKTITPAKFRQLFGELSLSQKDIIDDNQSKYIVVAAGPGSGKTRVLVHKLASLLFMEDVKHEQLLMLTFSRSAAAEFKKRLLKLYGKAANYIDIKTFHSYCFDLLGKVGTIEKSSEIISETVEKIKNKEVEPSQITKTVMVIDEAQDMDANEFELVKCLMRYNKGMRVIAVGDDDQNIYEFRGSSSEYMKKLINAKDTEVYELVDNYRSLSNLVSYTNQFIKRIKKRLKSTEIQPVKKENGKIRLIRYRTNNLTTPVVNDIMSQELIGSTCVLTAENNEALQITGLLINNNLQAKLIQSNEGFNLYNLLEIRYFIDETNIDKESSAISDDIWESAKRKLADKFWNSPHLEISQKIVRDFELTHGKTKYKSDFDIFIRESNYEDFYNTKTETIFVSTMHKAKGREFDNVFIMLDDFMVNTEEKLRVLYVAMTRAKNNLTIHYNGNYLDNIKAENLEIINDNTIYQPPNKLILKLSYRDVYLDYFISNRRQLIISELHSGEELAVNDKGCLNSKGQDIVRFSKKGIEKIEPMKHRNYVLKSAKVAVIVYWKKENTENEVRIVLPELYFERSGNA